MVVREALEDAERDFLARLAGVSVSELVARAGVERLVLESSVGREAA